MLGNNPNGKLAKLKDGAMSIGYKMLVLTVGIMVVFSLSMSGFVPNQVQDDVNPIGTASAATWGTPALDVVYDNSTSGYDIEYDDQNASFTSGETVTLQFEDPNSTNIDMTGVNFTVGFSDSSLTVSNVTTTVNNAQNVTVTFTVDQAVDGAYMYVQTTTAEVDVNGDGTIGVGDAATGNILASYDYTVNPDDPDYGGTITAGINSIPVEDDTLKNNISVDIQHYYNGSWQSVDNGTLSTVNDTLSAYDLDNTLDYRVVYDGGVHYNDVTSANITVTDGTTHINNADLTSATYIVDGNLTHYDSNISTDNQTVELVNSAGNVSQSVQTDVNGSYQFTGVEPGDYTVRTTINNDTVKGNITVDANVTADLAYTQSVAGGLVGGVSNWVSNILDAVLGPIGGLQDVIDGIGQFIDDIITGIQDIVNYNAA